MDMVCVFGGGNSGYCGCSFGFLRWSGCFDCGVSVCGSDSNLRVFPNLYLV